MRLNKSRIAPLADSELDPEMKETLAKNFNGRPVFNIFRTLARAPKAYKSFMRWGGYILSDHNSIAPREREIIILRTGYNWKSGYEWAQHVRIGKECGLTDLEIQHIKDGPLAPSWTPLESAMPCGRRADDRCIYLRSDLGRTGGAEREAAHGPGDDRRPVYAGVDDAELVRRAAGR